LRYWVIDFPHNSFRNTPTNVGDPFGLSTFHTVFQKHPHKSRKKPFQRIVAEIGLGKGPIWEKIKGERVTKKALLNQSPIKRGHHPFYPKASLKF